MVLVGAAVVVLAVYCWVSGVVTTWLLTRMGTRGVHIETTTKGVLKGQDEVSSYLRSLRCYSYGGIAGHYGCGSPVPHQESV